MSKGGKMNKKGYITFVFIVFIAIAFGLFFFSLGKDSFGITVKGEWHLDFLNNNFLEAEKQLLKVDSTARNLGSSIALDLAENGGFLPDKESPCGKFDDFNQWNKKNTWCLPQPKILAQQLAQEKVKSSLPEYQFKDFEFNGKSFLAKGDKEIVKNSLGEYIFDTSFAANVGYSFDEYDKLAADADKIVRCRNLKDFKKCLKENKPEYWRYKDCDASYSSIPEERKITKFCVKSPELSLIATGEKVFSDFHPLSYNLALDLAPTKPFSLEEISIKKTGEKHVVSFEMIKTADSYSIHHTDWPSVNIALERSADMKEIFSTMSDDYYLETVEISNLENSCPDQKEIDAAYLCNGKVIYTLELNQAVYFTITSMSDGEESEVNKFVLIS